MIKDDRIMKTEANTAIFNEIKETAEDIIDMLKVDINEDGTIEGMLQTRKNDGWIPLITIRKNYVSFNFINRDGYSTSVFYHVETTDQMAHYSFERVDYSTINSKRLKNFKTALRAIKKLKDYVTAKVAYYEEQGIYQDGRVA